MRLSPPPQRLVAAWRASALLFVSALVLTACGSGSAGSEPRLHHVVYRFGVVGNRGAISQLQLDTADPCLRHQRSGRADRHLQLRRLCADLERHGVGLGGGQLRRARQRDASRLLDPRRSRSTSRRRPDHLIGESHALRRCVGHRLTGPRLGLGPQRRWRPLPVWPHGASSERACP